MSHCSCGYSAKTRPDEKGGFSYESRARREGAPDWYRRLIEISACLNSGCSDIHKTWREASIGAAGVAFSKEQRTDNAVAKLSKPLRRDRNELSLDHRGTGHHRLGPRYLRRRLAARSCAGRRAVRAHFRRHRDLGDVDRAARVAGRRSAAASRDDISRAYGQIAPDVSPMSPFTPCWSLFPLPALSCSSRAATPCRCSVSTRSPLPGWLIAPLRVPSKRCMKSWRMRS